jgi:hypothetical protein
MNARIAGITFLLYIVTGITSMALSGANGGTADTTAAKLASIAGHPWLMRINVVMALLSAAYALVLGVTLYSLTRDQDHDLAITALFCRAGEGLISVIFCVRSLALLSLAMGGSTPAVDPAATQALAGVLLKIGVWAPLLAATCFAVGSTLFSCLFLRARSIPVALSWLGIVSSVLLLPLLPLQLVGLLHPPLVSLMWMPMLAFEVGLALWLIIKGVAASRTSALVAGQGS